MASACVAVIRYIQTASKHTAMRVRVAPESSSRYICLSVSLYGGLQMCEGVDVEILPYLDTVTCHAPCLPLATFRAGWKLVSE
jgi:hypothetical protein